MRRKFEYTLSLDKSYQSFKAKVDVIKAAQLGRELTIKQRMKNVAQHVAEGVKESLEDITSDRDNSSNSSLKTRASEMVGSFKEHMYAPMKEGQELFKEAVGKVSNPNILSLEEAVQSLYQAMKDGHYYLAISQLEAIERQYPIRDKNYYDGGLVKSFLKMREDVITMLSEVAGLDQDSKEKVTRYRQRLFEEKKSALVGILRLRRMGQKTTERRWKRYSKRLIYPKRILKNG
ncbi:Uncharacterised protein [Legionella lansingensis]|uniref:Uncharacterized protein n=1 Tax=Legionella lansingensis TaxID=45067 RepID=A0A0W0VG35_9GAMM|nr:hypothetical protein [Legionella lansingensis]KTD19073.1 hypothetical protein Llan_2273 [Legionella lansingensis]SNV52087.1 Uncharacterised protein [Legionella lansingensis]